MRGLIRKITPSQGMPLLYVVFAFLFGGIAILGASIMQLVMIVVTCVQIASAVSDHTSVVHAVLVVIGVWAALWAIVIVSGILAALCVALGTRD